MCVSVCLYVCLCVCICVFLMAGVEDRTVTYIGSSDLEAFANKRERRTSEVKCLNSVLSPIIQLVPTE